MSRYCPSGPARQVAGRHVVGQPDAVGGLVDGVTARVLRTTMAQITLLRPDDRIEALRDTMSELLSMDEPRKRFAAMMSALDIRDVLEEGHPLLGRRVPDCDLVTSGGPLRVFTLPHDARPVLLNLGEPGNPGDSRRL